MQIQYAIVQVMTVYFTTQVAALAFFISAFKFCNGTNANFFFPIFCSPDGQWCTPEPAAAQVPVNHILQPVAKPSFAG